jgi:hypothetical protein
MVANRTVRSASACGPSVWESPSCGGFGVWAQSSQSSMRYLPIHGLPHSVCPCPGAHHRRGDPDWERHLLSFRHLRCTVDGVSESSMRARWALRCAHLRLPQSCPGSRIRLWAVNQLHEYDLRRRAFRLSVEHTHCRHVAAAVARSLSASIVNQSLEVGATTPDAERSHLKGLASRFKKCCA